MIVIDRFEGNYAICEFDGEMIAIPKGCLPEGAKEGIALKLIVEDNSNDRSRIAKKQNSLFK